MWGHFKLTVVFSFRVSEQHHFVIRIIDHEVDIDQHSSNLPLVEKVDIC